MISDKLQCIFVHVPRTAGQSIETVFLRLHGLTWETRAPLLLRPNNDPARGPPQLAHLKAYEYKSLGYVDQEAFDRFYKFAFVRNPWDRLVSEYHYRKHLHPRKNFRSFVHDSFKNTGDWRRSRHIIPQFEFVTNKDGRYIVDFIGRFETLETDFAQVARRLGLGFVALDYCNQSYEGILDRIWRAFGGKRGPVSSNRFKTKVADRRLQDYYDAELRDCVGDFYAEDVARFGYSFDGSSKNDRIV